jgi:hypothetical protein
MALACIFDGGEDISDALESPKAFNANDANWANFTNLLFFFASFATFEKFALGFVTSN